MAFDIENKYIQEAETELGATLPVEYKSIMAQNNGGDVILDEEFFQLFPILDTSTKKRISRTSNHIIYETAQTNKWKSFPKNALAIASDSCGNFLIFQKEDEKYSDKLYLWSHETGELELVANCFSELEVE